MTPLMLANGLKAFVLERMKHYNDTTAYNEQYTAAARGYTAKPKEMNVYALSAPIVKTGEERREQQLATVVIRPYSIGDGEDETLVKVAISVMLRSDDMEHGFTELYHIVDFLRHELLAHNPIAAKWYMRPGSLVTTIPIEQSYPNWLGVLECEFYLPQAEYLPPNVYD